MICAQEVRYKHFFWKEIPGSRGEWYWEEKACRGSRSETLMILGTWHSTPLGLSQLDPMPQGKESRTSYPLILFLIGELVIEMVTASVHPCCLLARLTQGLSDQLILLGNCQSGHVVPKAAPTCPLSCLIYLTPSKWYAGMADRTQHYSVHALVYCP